MVLDEKAKPKTIDLIDGKTVNQAPDSLLAKITPPDLYGIYELNGDTLKVAAKLLDKKRPTTFAKAREISLTIYTRGEIPKDVNIVDPLKTAKTAKGMKGPKLAGDLAALQGTWTTGNGVFHGPGKETMTIQGDNLVTLAKGARGMELRFQGRIQLDESASPKTIDFLDVKVGTRKQPNALGIYQLDGDTLTLHKSGRGRPRSNVFETGSEQGRVATWTRGTVVVQGRPTPGITEGTSKPAADGGQGFQGATVVSFSPRKVVLRTAEGQQVEATLIGGKGFDLEGKPVGRGDALLKPGNVIDVTIEPIPTSKIGLQKIREFRLVRAGDGSQ